MARSYSSWVGDGGWRGWAPEVLPLVVVVVVGTWHLMVVVTVMGKGMMTRIRMILGPGFST